MKKTQLKFKMSQLLKVFLVVLLIVVVGMVFYLNRFTLGEIKKNEIEKEQIILENMTKVWDDMLANNTIYIDNFMANDPYMVELLVAKDSADTLYALQDIRNSLNEYAMLNYGMEEVFFYSEKAGENGYLANTRKSAAVNVLLKDQIKDIMKICSENDSFGCWIIEEMYGKNYLIYTQRRNDCYMGCWVPVEDMLEKLTKNSTESKDSYYFFLADQDGISRTDAYLCGKKIDFESLVYKDEETGAQYLQIVQPSSNIPVTFVEHIELQVADNPILYIRNIMIVIGIALVLSIALWSGVLEYVLYRPIRNLVANMTQISEGDLDTRIDEESRLKEIHLLYNTFNKMAEEIKNLKIAVYEKELNEQKTRLEYMQIQIHPHFLVNGLNSVCAMIDMKKIIPAKEMCTYLAEYFRFNYQNNTGLVPIMNELKHVETYINIQKMRHPGKLEFEYEIEEACKVLLIPPILILTFVGNSFKYGMNLEDYTNSIHIKIWKKNKHTIIQIRDKGPGFTDEVLDAIINLTPIIRNDRECIGMHNAIVRLKLFYGEDVDFKAYNDGDAVVEIGIPN